MTKKTVLALLLATSVSAQAPTAAPALVPPSCEWNQIVMQTPNGLECINCPPGTESDVTGAICEALRDQWTPTANQIDPMYNPNPVPTTQAQV